MKPDDKDDGGGVSVDISNSLIRPGVFRAWIVALALFAFIGAGCEDGKRTETSMFEAAEAAYRQGNYEDALLAYQAFLKRYPSSPLAVTGELRVRNIRREVASMMERPGTPRPVYHGFKRDQSISNSQSVESPQDAPAGFEIKKNLD